MVWPLASVAVPQHGGHLVAQALAAAGGHEHEGVAAAAHMLDDSLLRAAKLGVAKDLLKNSSCGVGGLQVGRKHDGSAGARHVTRRAEFTIRASPGAGFRGENVVPRNRTCRALPRSFAA